MSPPLLAAVYEPFSSGTTGDGLRFVHGELLWVWPVAVAALAGFFWWSWRRRRELVSSFVRSRLLAQLTVGVSARRQKLRLALLTAAAASILLALTRPQWGYDWEEARQKGLDIIVAIDTSRSMLAEDVPPNRFTRARLAALDLMRLARADRLGLVAFAGDAFLHCPLTLDDEAFRQSLEVLEVGIITQGGTALTTAIETALSAFKAEGDNHRVLVLFTDGEDHDSQVDSAVEQARQAGLRIFTVGVGTAAGELLRVTDDQGVSSFVKDPQGNPVKSRLNESILQQIATSTGGFYLPLRGPEIMQTLYEKGLAPLPKSEHSTRLFRQYRERFQWPLGIALILLVAEMFLPERRRAPRPATGTSQSLAALPIGLLLLVPTFSSHAASPGQALRQYDSGRFSEARRNFQQLIEKDPHDPRLHFNSGAAAYRDGKFEDAARSFSEALTAPDLQLQQRAFYNLGNALYRLGEQTPDARTRQQQWEQAVKQFEGATQLDPADTDARDNLEFVRQKLEELKQQQQQQQQSPSQDQKDQKEDPDQSKQNQDPSQPDQKDSGKDQQQQKPDAQQQQSPSPQQDQPSQSPDEKKDSPQSDSKNQAGQDQKDQQQQSSSQQSQQSGQQPQPSGQGEGKPGESGDTQDEKGKPQTAVGQMTTRQAEQLLDAQKGNERALIFLPAKPGAPKGRIIKDW